MLCRDGPFTVVNRPECLTARSVISRCQRAALGHGKAAQELSGAHGLLAGTLDLDEANGAFSAGDRQRVVERRAGRAAALGEARADNLDALRGAALGRGFEPGTRETARGRGSGCGPPRRAARSRCVLRFWRSWRRRSRRPPAARVKLKLARFDARQRLDNERGAAARELVMQLAGRDVGRRSARSSVRPRGRYRALPPSSSP